MNLTTGEVVLGITQVALIVSMWARLETRFESHAKQANKRLGRVEKEIGIENGDEPGFTRRGECKERHQRLDGDMRGVQAKVEDHEHRLTAVETRQGAAG